MSDVSAWRKFNEDVITEFRANDGKITGQFAGAPMLLLTTTGAKSGKPFTTPLVHTTDGDRVVIIASKGGAPSHPDWYHNIVAHPDVHVEIGNKSMPANATIATGEERQRLFDAQAAVMPNFKDYAAATTREIPVVVLELQE